MVHIESDLNLDPDLHVCVHIQTTFNSVCQPGSQDDADCVVSGADHYERLPSATRALALRSATDAKRTTLVHA